MTQHRRVTINDVASRAGVSVATVSKVINGRYGVAAETFARVQAVIDELGYESSLVAQSLRSHRTNVIGILVADLEPFSTELLKGAAEAIRGTGYELVIYSAGGRAASTRLGAALPVPGQRHPDRRRHPGHPDRGGRAASACRVVAVDPHTGPSSLPTVDSDNLKGAHAGDRVPDRPRPPAHRLPGRPARPRVGPAARAGLPRGARRRGHPVRPRAGTGRRATTSRRGQRGGPELLSLDPRPTAVFAATTCPRSRPSGWPTLGLSVPDDLSVVGFDNIPESALNSPPLTTVDQSIQRMGFEAVRLLIDLIRGGSPEPHAHHAADRARRPPVLPPVDVVVGSKRTTEAVHQARRGGAGYLTDRMVSGSWSIGVDNVFDTMVNVVDNGVSRAA